MFGTRCDAYGARADGDSRARSAPDRHGGPAAGRNPATDDHHCDHQHGAGAPRPGGEVDHRQQARAGHCRERQLQVWYTLANGVLSEVYFTRRHRR